MFNTLEFIRLKFPFLEAKEALKIIANTKIRKLKAGEVFIQEGEVAEVTAYIAKGILRAYTTVEGEERTVLFRKEGELIGAPPSMFKGSPASETVEGLENSVILVIDWKGFRRLAKTNKQVGNAYTQAVEDMMLEAVERIQDFTILSPEQRYLKFIKEEKDLVNRVPLKHIASFIGVSKVSLSRMRARIAKSKS